MPVYIAFLRGVNVGGHRKLKMADLKAVHEKIGHAEVATYLQSGNVVFSAPRKNAAKLTCSIEAAYEKQLGFNTSVLLRTDAELARIASQCPIKLTAKREPKFLHAIFLSAAPADANIENLAAYEGPEKFEVVKDTLYVYYTSGSGRSKLTLPYIERRLGVTATGRNWNTIIALAELAAERR